MKSRKIQETLTILTAVLIMIIGSGAAFAQGKGRGGGNNGGGEKRGGGQSEQRGQNNRGEREKSSKERPDMQRQERPQMERQERKAQREQQREQRSPMQQQRQEQPQREQVRRPYDVRSEQRRQALQEMPDYREYGQRQNRVERVERERAIRNQRGDDYRTQSPSQPRTAPWSNATPNNYGYYRSREAHRRNAERKAWKNEEKALSRLGRGERSYSSGYQPDYYSGDDRYASQYPEHQRMSFLRSVISTVLGSNSGYNNNNYPQNQPAYYGNSYDPGYYGGNNYSNYPQYQSYAAAPQYFNYQPYADMYYPQYADDQYLGDRYSGDPQYGYDRNSAQGGGFVQRLFSRLLALGYEQGYNAGLTARSSGDGDRYYSDPYEYENSDFTPYSYAVGTNRRSLSDGYELGYNDALYNQSGPDRNENGNIDLVSLLISSALQIL